MTVLYSRAATTPHGRFCGVIREISNYSGQPLRFGALFLRLCCAAGLSNYQDY
jgi:hypothetical protein